LSATISGRTLLCCITVFAVCVTVSPARADLDLDWLENPAPPVGRITSTLNAIDSLSPPEALEAAKRLLLRRHSLHGASRLSATFLAAAALERAERPELASEVYEQLRDAERGEGFAPSARVRLRSLLSGTEGERGLRSEYLALTEEPPVDGWFRLAGEWKSCDTHVLGFEAVLNLQSRDLAFRLFEGLRSYSVFPQQYSYLFILFVLVVTAKVLAFPIALRAVRTRYRGKEGAMLLYLDLAIMIWVPLEMADYAVRMRSDGASFLWVADVTRFDLKLAVVALGIFLLSDVLPSWKRKERSPAGVWGGSLVLTGLLGVVLWALSWPSYVLVFWVLLILMGELMHRVSRLLPCPAGAREGAA
jgi:hypothetical protein